MYRIFTLTLIFIIPIIALGQRNPKIEIYLPDQIYYPLAASKANGSFFYCETSALPKMAFIADKEIIGYEITGDTTQGSHKGPVYNLKINQEARNKMNDLMSKGIPLCCGIPFVITINRKPVYTGYFWNVLSSFYCSWITIDYIGPDQLTINGNFDGNHPDPRNDQQLLEAFKVSNRLIATRKRAEK